MNEPTVIQAPSLCPDCNAERRLIEINPGLKFLQILHDDTCPWLTERKTNGRSSS